MVRINYTSGNYDGTKYIEGACLSTDTEKPTTGIATGSLLLEVDTGKVLAYDEVSGEWGEV